MPTLSPYARTHACFQAAAAARIKGKPDVIQAAASGDFNLVKDHCIADAGCIRKADGKYDSLLHTRASDRPRSSSSMINFSNPIFCSDNTALHWSCLNGHTQVCEFLLDNKADIGAKDIGYTPYTCALYLHNMFQF